MNENDSAAMTRAVSHALVWCRPIIVLKVRRVMGRGRGGGVLILVRFEFHLHVFCRLSNEWFAASFSWHGLGSRNSAPSLILPLASRRVGSVGSPFDATVE